VRDSFSTVLYSFTVLVTKAKGTGLFTVHRADDLVYQRSVGGFGWSCTPAAFQVVTRAVQWELRGVLEGCCSVCV
jgi:hypothetical protein